jgi:hypothetical protein
MTNRKLGLNARRVATRVAAAAFLVVASGVFSSAAANPMRFGADIEALPRARSQGLPLTYGSLWLGAWTQRWGWSDANTKLRAASAGGVTPVISWWYWGDDISPSCIEYGCNDRYHGVRKDKATWYRMTSELAANIEAALGSREAIVVVETEFNKDGIEDYEPFDGYLAEIAAILHARGNIKVVVGFGNWGQHHWPRFDRAVASADLLGVQTMRSSMREPGSRYTDAIGSLVQSVHYLQGTFRKPVVVTDLAFSSYPSEGYEAVQAQVIGELFARMHELKAAGVVAIMYRMVADDPNFDTANYHGIAERHWGLLRADGSQKPAFSIFAAGVQRENGSGTPSTPNCSAPGAPQNFAFSVQGAMVTLRWSAPSSGGAPLAYVVEAGTGPGLANLARVPVVAPLVQVTAPAGTYFTRVRSQNACGISAASNEQVITVR